MSAFEPTHRATNLIRKGTNVGPSTLSALGEPVLPEGEPFSIEPQAFQRNAPLVWQPCRTADGKLIPIQPDDLEPLDG